MEWSYVDIPVTNVTPYKLSVNDLSGSEVSVIKEYNQQDIRLYDKLYKRYVRLNERGVT